MAPEDNDINDESDRDYESKRGDEDSEDSDESDSGDGANTDNSYGENNLLDRVYDAVRNGQSPYLADGPGKAQRDPSPAAFATRSLASWQVRDGATPRRQTPDEGGGLSTPK